MFNVGLFHIGPNSRLGCDFGCRVEHGTAVEDKEKQRNGKTQKKKKKRADRLPV